MDGAVAAFHRVCNNDHTMEIQSGSVSPVAPTQRGMAMIFRLRCPVCDSGLVEDGPTRVKCKAEGHAYEVRDGLPILLSHQASAANVAGNAKQEKYESEEETGFRASLRRIARRPLVRTMREIYSRFNGWVTPRSPLSLSTWMDRIRPLLPASPRSVLDLGGGSGSNRSYFCDQGDEYLILEVDPDVRFVRENLGKNAYVIGDAHSTVLAPAQFDLILMIEVLEHMRDPFKIFENCSRWLRPGGRLFIKVPQYWHIHGWPSDYFRYTVYGLKELCRRANLEVMDTWPLGGPCVLLHAMFMLNLGRFLEWPILSQLVSNPLLLAAKAMDRLFFPDYTRLKHPDTRGWILIARKG